MLSWLGLILLTSYLKLVFDSFGIFLSAIYILLLLFIYGVGIVFVVFDEGCLWCRSLAYLIRRISNVDVIPLRRAVEIVNTRLEKGKIYVFDGGVRDGLKPLIKLLLGRGRIGALRIIPSYTAYKLARGANLKCGCSYERRIFIKGLISLALTALIAQKIPLAWGKEESRHPLSKVKIVKTLRLEGKDLEEAVKKMKGSIDVKNIVDVSQIDPNNAIAAKHILEFNNEENTLIAVGATLINKSETVVYYELEKPLEWLKTEAWLITPIKEGVSTTRSINGKKILKPSSNESDYSECSCITQCQNDWDCGGPPNACAVGCCRGRDDCLLVCLVDQCGECFIACLGGLLACIACVAVWCPAWFVVCWTYLCCDENCRVCTTSGGP